MDKSPCCNAELLGYSGGGHIIKGYPYESGYYCTCCGREFSNLQISRRALEKSCEPWFACKHPTKHDWKERRKKIEMEQALENHMKTPKDISKDTLEEQATTLTLHFIGFRVKPIGISDDTYIKCLEAFSSNRGKVEGEMEAILETLKKEK